MLLTALLSGALAQDVITKTLPATMPELRVVSAHSRVTLRSDPGAAETVVHATPVRWSEGCQLLLDGDASQARATVALPEEGFAPHCRTDLDIVLAGDTRVVLEIDRGQVLLHGPQAPVEVALGTGRVEGTLAGQGSRVAVRRGHVDLYGLDVPVEVDVGVGGAVLEMDEALAGTVAARVGVGRVRARFPYGTWLDKEVDAVVGRVWTAIPTRTSSPTRLEARAALGSVRIETVLTDEVDEALVAELSR